MGAGFIQRSARSPGRPLILSPSPTVRVARTARRRWILVSRIERELDIESVPHLTCVGHSRAEIRDILTTLQEAGIKHLMALRGDAPKNDPHYHPHAEGFHHASDLIQFVAGRIRLPRRLCVLPGEAPGRAAPGRRHPLAQVQAGLWRRPPLPPRSSFFDNDCFFGFRDKAVAAGVTMPLIAGILPVTSLGQIQRIGELSGQDIPQKLLDVLGEGDGQRGDGARH